MRALLRKEASVLLVLALVLLVTLTGNWVAKSTFDWSVEDSLYAAPPRAIPLVLFVSLVVGAALGLAQVAVERGNHTVSYLVHRELAVDRILLAKTLAAWLFLAVGVALPLVLIGLWERTFSPLGELVRWERVLELLVVASVGPAAHGLGLLIGTLRQGTALKVFILLLAAAGLAALAGLLLILPIGSPVLGRLVFVGVQATLAFGFLRLARANFLHGGDPDRAPSRGMLTALAALGAIFVVLPVHAAMSLLEPVIRTGMIAGRPTLFRHESGRIARIVETEGGAFGGDAFEVDADRRILSDELLLDFYSFHSTAMAWTRVWSPDGREWSYLKPRRVTGRGFEWSIAPDWVLLAQANLVDPQEPFVEAMIAIYWDRDEDIVRAIYLPRALPNARKFFRALPSSLPVEVELAPEPGFALSEALAGMARPAYAGLEFIPFYWAAQARVGRYVPAPPDREGVVSLPGAKVSLDEARELMEVRPVVTGSNRLAPTVEIRDARTDEVLLVHSYRARGWYERTGTAVLTALTVVKAPAVLLTSFEGDVHEPAIVVIAEPMVRGFARPDLLLANLALAAGLALAVARALRRRGASTPRVGGWCAVVLAFGPWGGLLFLALEPLPVRRARREQPAPELLIRTA